MCMLPTNDIRHLNKKYIFKDTNKRLMRYIYAYIVILLGSHYNIISLLGQRIFFYTIYL